MGHSPKIAFVARRITGGHVLHIVIFLDQNPASLGGVQASVLLQQKYLELAGHKVTVCAPKSRFTPAAGQIVYPSFPLALNREYAATASIRNAYSHVSRQLESLGVPVDVVHVQADWWGALLGVYFAKRQNLPLVHTLHTQLMIGATQVVGALGARFLIWLHSEVYSRLVEERPFAGHGHGWKYLAQVASRAQVVIAPSGHFARLAKAMGVARQIEVVPTGVDDVALDGLFHTQRSDTDESPVRFAWSGRFSNEKRLMVFLEAFKLAKIPAQVSIYGSGPLERRARRFIREHNLSGVNVVGRVTHQQMLHELASADALVQTSVGFETQGLTVTEAGVVGTPSILCDWNIADDLPADSFWRVENPSVEALARALREAHQDIVAGRSKSIDLRHQLFQSVLTQRSVDIYQRAISMHGN
ncbi:MAG: glycosyltransferase [Micrococcales bacterium]